MRDELLNEALFFDLEQARRKVANWLADYNHNRPHSAIGYETPAAYAVRLTAMAGRRSGNAPPAGHCSIGAPAPN